MGRRKVGFFERIGYILEYIIVVPLAKLLSLIPFAWIKGLSRFLGWIFFHVNTRDKKWAYMNLGIIYKDNPLSKEEQDKIVRQLYRNIVRFGLEYLKLGQITAKNYQKFARFDNFEAVMNTQATGKGGIVMTLHLGNWEYMGSVAAKIGCNLAVIINRQFNPYTDLWLKRLREKKGKVKCFYNEIADTKGLAKHLRGGGTIALVADQTFYFQPIFVPFFGMPSATANGPAKLHTKFGSPIVMGHCYRDTDDKYVFKFEDPWTYTPTGDQEKDNAAIMTYINSRYEEYIRKYPEQWFSLLHPRWEKTRPEDFENIDFDPF
ncbi:MAG: hypothetical protein A2Y33_10570 [Spirochaetes bacterium GWF1_51_8]|nr:MAG: hypothetical protein A2Y33_10570 [Spirochaetes bacterium GWF1_51_8]